MSKLERATEDLEYRDSVPARGGQGMRPGTSASDVPMCMSTVM